MLKAYRSKRFGSDEEYWEKSWAGVDERELSVSGVEEFEELPVVLRYVRKEHRILDTGCGLAQFVYYLGKRGYQIHGVDFSYELLERARSVSATMDLIAGDVNRLPIKNGRYDAIFSFGIIEHIEGGPDKCLFEMNRILRKSGYLFLGVPYLNAIRKIVLPFLLLKQWYGEKTGRQFNQYIFSRRAVVRHIIQSGFDVVDEVKMYPFTMFLQNRMLNLVRKIVVRGMRAGSGGIQKDSEIMTKGEEQHKHFLDNFFCGVKSRIKKALQKVTPHFIFLVCVKK